VQAGGWVCARKKVPVFADAAMTVPGFVHQIGCPAEAHPDGHLPDRRCASKCSSAVVRVGAMVPMRVVQISEQSILAHLQDSGLFWVERAGLQRASAPANPVQVHDPLRAHRLIPPDYIAIETYLGIHPGTKFPRRRRVVQGGEIVLLRNELAKHDGELSTWRYLGMTMHHGVPAVILIDPRLAPVVALNPGWGQHLTLPLRRGGKAAEPHQLLLPVFPLPDGTKDPGWRP
jgi:hypothetical protein